MRSEALAERVAAYVARPDPDAFGPLATALAGELYEGDAGFRELFDRDGAGPPTDWRSIPPARTVPARAATTVLEREARERAFQAACLAGREPLAILGLTSATGDSSGIVARFGGPGSTSAIEGGRVDVGTARSWLAGRQRDRSAALVWTEREAFERLLGTLERQDLRFQLPPGSLVVVQEVIDTNAAPTGFASIANRSAERLGVAPASVFCGLAWNGLPTPLFGRIGEGGGLEAATPSPWTRVRTLDPATLAETPDRSGRLSVVDLTIAEGSPHVLTATEGSISNGAVTIRPS